MFVNLGQAMKRRSSASGNNSDRQPEEQFNAEQSFDPLSYRLQHLNQQGFNSGMDGDDVDPFNVGSADSFSDDLEDVEIGVVKLGAVDDAGWGANNNKYDGSDYDDDCYQEGDGLFLDFGGRTPDQVNRPKRNQRESLSTPSFGGGGSQSTHWDSTVEQTRRSFSTISCTKNDDVSDGLADIERQCVEMISNNNVPTSPHELSMPLEQMIAPQSLSVGKTSRRAQSISTLSTLSSPTDKCRRDIASADQQRSSGLPPPPLTYKPISRRQSLSSVSSKGEAPNAITQPDNSNFAKVSVVPQRVETQEKEEEQCPRLEQLQQMTLEELKSELMTIQGQSKTNLENSWKAAERMRVENSELEEKAGGLKTKLDTAFKAGPPVSRRHTDSVQYDDYDIDEDMSDLNTVDRREGMKKQTLSDNDVVTSRDSGRRSSGLKSSVSSMAEEKTLAWSEEEKDDYDDSGDDVIEAFTLDLESPSDALRQRNNMRHVESSYRSGVSGDSSEFGFFCLDMSQSVVKTPFALTDAGNSQADQSDGSSDFGATKSGVYYPPPENDDDDDDEGVSNPRQAVGDSTTTIKVVETKDGSGGKVSRKPGFKKKATLDGDQNQNTPSASGNRRRPSRMVRRPSFMGLFGLTDSSRGGESEVSSDCLDNSTYNQSTTSIAESILDIDGNIFQVEARSIMIEELENELNEKGDIVANVIDEIEGQKEEIDNCEVEITRLRAKLDDECKELTCTQSTLQQSVKELIQWDSAIESRLDRTEGQRQILKQKESELRIKLASKEPNKADYKIELKCQRSKCKEECNAIQEKSSGSLAMINDSLRALNCDNKLQQRSKQLVDSFDTQTYKLYQLLRNSDRVAAFTTLKKHIEDQRDRIINASDKLFCSETDLRGNLIRLKLTQLEGSDECTHTAESSLVSEFTEAVLTHVVKAREEHARFVFAAVTKVDEFLLWWDHLLKADSTLEECEELGDASHISSILERVLTDVTEELAASQAKIDEECELFQSNLLSAGILNQQISSQKLSANKESNVESSDYRAELDNLNEQIFSLETSLSERQAVRKNYASTLDQLHEQDEADSKANLELLDNIQAQVKILGKKLAMDDSQIASLRKSLQEKKELVANLEYGEKRRDNIMHT